MKLCFCAGRVGKQKVGAQRNNSDTKAEAFKGKRLLSCVV